MTNTSSTAHSTESNFKQANLNTDSLTLNESILGKIVTQRQCRLKDIEKPTVVLKPSNRSLVEALSLSNTGLILECKQSSPSRGLLTDDYQPAIIAKHYQAFCSAVSVLTEPDFFSGCLQDLTKVRHSITQPVLCKDFIIETSQLYSARAAGADVILLMLSVISDQFWIACFEIANELGLDIITEVNSETEVLRAIALPAKIIGINNRNLHTLKTDISMTEQLAKLIPSDRLIISESGISKRQHLKRLAPLVDGFLIGSSLMQSSSIPLALRKLLFGEIKVCGLTNRKDADQAWQLGASFGGVILTPKSSRFVSNQQAITVCEQQPMPMVGVFMDQSNDEIMELASSLNLSAVQLHGCESKSQLQQLLQLRKSLVTPCEIWKTITCSEIDDRFPTITEAGGLKADFIELGIDRVLIDIPKEIPNDVSNENTQNDYLSNHQSNHQLKYQGLLTTDNLIIAGGLTVESIGQLAELQRKQQQTLNTDQQAGFDICSSLESSAGIKDANQLKLLFQMLLPTTRSRKDMKKETVKNSTINIEAAQHYFSGYGGAFVAEILVPVLEQLEEEYVKALNDPEFHKTLSNLLSDFAGRPTPLYRCRNITKDFNADLYLKREDLLHGGAHKTNQVLAQGLLTKRMGKNRVIAETGAGQHGVATAMVCALLDLDCVIYMGEKDVLRQQPNVQRMELLGAKVITVTSGSSSLKDAINEALRDWISSYETTHYLLGTVAGPAPFPDMVRQFQQIIGIEARQQIQLQAGRLPDMAIACIGGGSNAIGLFHAFIGDENVKLIGVEAAGKGLETTEHGATMNKGQKGIFQGCLSKIIQTDDGQIEESYSISAGLDYPGVGPQHVALQENNLAEYVAVTDDEALDASLLLTRKEGIIPALESSHALAYAMKLVKQHPMNSEKLCLLLNLSGRGDKDLTTVMAALKSRAKQKSKKEPNNAN